MTTHPSSPVRIVSRDFVSGASDGTGTSGSNISHDYSRKYRGDQTIRERVVLSRRVTTSKPTFPLNEAEHMRRLLRTEFNGGVVLGFIFGAFVSVVVLALSSPWWAPVVAWMVR